MRATVHACATDHALVVPNLGNFVILLLDLLELLRWAVDVLSPSCLRSQDLLQSLGLRCNHDSIDLCALHPPHLLRSMRRSLLRGLCAGRRLRRLRCHGQGCVNCCKWRCRRGGLRWCSSLVRTDCRRDCRNVARVFLLRRLVAPQRRNLNCSNCHRLRRTTLCPGLWKHLRHPFVFPSKRHSAVKRNSLARKPRQLPLQVQSQQLTEPLLWLGLDALVEALRTHASCNPAQPQPRPSPSVPYPHVLAPRRLMCTWINTW
mmetsp:Transcript_73307/g.238563  ORF Transcript_73307/g.238563 Transcript_73307/m.238563 type:complete len:260 (-) Transcript_73307:52-831(-)